MKGLRIDMPAPAAISPPRSSVVHAWLTADDYRALAIAGSRVGLNADQVAAKVLSSLIKNNCLDKALA